MSKDLCCPLCGGKELSRTEVKENEKYFLFDFDNKWVCKNCGCFFSENEEYTGELVATKISKREFFKIIFSAIKEICGKKFLTKERQKDIISLYEANIKTYYKEVAELQADLFYEADCRQNDYWLIEQLRPLRDEKILDNKL